MAEYRLPGPLCTVLGSFKIDTGTMCLGASKPPGPANNARPAQTPKRNKPHRPKVKAQPARKSTLTAQDFEEAAKLLGPDVSIALVHAFADVESGGRSGMGPAGLPVIAYEGHVFRKLTNKAYDEDHPLLSSKYVKKAGPEWQQNNKDQATAWATLEAAIALDRDAALQACSWGMFQVMGFNFKSCGYATAEGFVAAMKAGEKGQLMAFVGYCKKRPGMVQAMLDKDYAGMASRYNGNDYGDYDKRIEKAYRKHGGT